MVSLILETLQSQGRTTPCCPELCLDGGFWPPCCWLLFQGLRVFGGFGVFRCEGLTLLRDQSLGIYAWLGFEFGFGKLQLRAGVSWLKV